MEPIREFRRTGDLALFERIYLSVREDLKVFVAGKVPALDFDDVVQDVVIQIFRGLRGFRGELKKEFYGWFYAIARARISKYYQNRPRNVDLPDFDLLSKIIEESGHISDSDKIAFKDALEVLSKIDPECAKLLYERHFLGFCNGEIGETWGISEDAARKRVARCEESIPEI